MAAKKRTKKNEPARAIRSDAQRNYDHLLSVARVVIAEEGTEASLRDIARRAGVGLGTLYRHFPTRDALLETILRRWFEALAEEARELEATRQPHDALVAWVEAFTDRAGAYRGLAVSLVGSLRDASSPLYAACHTMRAAVGKLLERAQSAGHIRPDVDGADLFALINAVVWIADQAPSIAARRAHLVALVMDGLALQRTERRSKR